MSDVPLTPEQVALQEEQAGHEAYLHRVLVGLDQFFNVVADGHPDETISARSERLASSGNRFGKFMIWWLDKIQPQHGEKAEAGDFERAKTVKDIEAQALDVPPGDQ